MKVQLYYNIRFALANSCLLNVARSYLQHSDSHGDTPLSLAKVDKERIINYS